MTKKQVCKTKAQSERSHVIVRRECEVETHRAKYICTYLIDKIIFTKKSSKLTLKFKI